MREHNYYVYIVASRTHVLYRSDKQSAAKDLGT